MKSQQKYKNNFIIMDEFSPKFENYQCAGEIIIFNCMNG